MRSQKLDEDVAIRGEQVLMSPRLRLDAELAWLPGVAPNRVWQLIEQPNLGAEDATGLPLLAGANVAAHRCAIGLFPNYHELILRFYRERSPDKILNALNSERRASGFPEVTPELLKESLRGLLQLHTLAVTHFIASKPKPGDTLLSILEANFRDEGEVIEFLDALVELYENHAAAALGSAENAISTRLDSIQTNPASLEQHLPAFSHAISEWASAAAPRQYILSHRHVRDPRTERLLARIRGVCLHVYNELDDARTPFALTKAALPAFERSPEHLDVLRADIATLEERITTQEALKVVEPLRDLITKLNAKHSILCTSLKQGNFKTDGRGAAGDLFRLFEKSAYELADTAASGAPFRMVLSLAIDLHNKSNASDEALDLVYALRDHKGLAKPDDVMETLKKNGLIIYETILQKNLKGALQGKRFRKSARIARDLAAATTEPEDRAGWEKLSVDLERRSIKQYASFGIFAAVVVGVILMASIAENPKPRNYSTASTQAPSSTYAPSDQTSLSVPGKGSGALTGPELRWCLLEIDRLKRIRQIAGEAPSNAVADAWNGRHDEWSSRCASKQYYKSDYATAERLVQTSAGATQNGGSLDLRVLEPSPYHRPCVLSQTF